MTQRRLRCTRMGNGIRVLACSEWCRRSTSTGGTSPPRSRVGTSASAASSPKGKRSFRAAIACILPRYHSF